MVKKKNIYIKENIIKLQIATLDSSEWTAPAIPPGGGGASPPRSNVVRGCASEPIIKVRIKIPESATM